MCAPQWQLAGTFLLCTRLKARIACKPLFDAVAVAVDGTAAGPEGTADGVGGSALGK